MTINGTDCFAMAAGAVAIGWVNWYFFIAGRSPASPARVAPATGGTQEQLITVDSGYSPAVVRVQAGQPVRLVFDRRDAGSCSEEVVFPDFGIRRFLPTGRRAVVEFTVPKAGRYEFMCGMSMLRGAVVAEEGAIDVGQARGVS